MEETSDRTHPATPRKLEKARERGDVAKSRDLVSVAVLTVAMAYLAWRGWAAWREQFVFSQSLLVQAARTAVGTQQLWHIAEVSIARTLWAALPFFALVLCAAVFANVAQTGPVLALRALRFDLDRINPATGLRNAFGMQMLSNAVRSSLKLLVLSGAAVIALLAAAPAMRQVGALPPAALLCALLDSLGSVGLKLAAALWLVAATDLVLARLRFARKQRMSGREVKDEVRQREGDPRVRSRLRTLRNELRKRTQSLRNTRNAHVLVTNPTHVAVALRYEHGRMAAPELVAKGSGLLAAAMRAIAARHAIPVVHSPALARKLFRELDIATALPPDFFADVARIMVWVIAMKQAREAAQGAAA